ncbi:MAG: FAD-binding oxidoreductase [Nitrosomonas sp.]|nr:FAD-binding oxidoreductase [Nitrosomonas sp.]
MLTASDITDNVTGKFSDISGICRPKNIREVIQIIRDARLSGTPIYPYSTGFNWGYGSRSPVVKGSLLVDLGGMNKILNADQISIDNPVAVIEPGVTQIQLHEFLKTHAPGLKFNVTGSGKDTSIIGNALDKGIGYMGPRKDDLFGLEIVTGAEKIIRTGFRRLGESSQISYNHPSGLGPILDGLFFQSNFGIVTSACFKLYPKRPKEIAISIALREENDLPQFINELLRLKREGLITGVTHIANRTRSRSTLEYGISRYLQVHCKLSGTQLVDETNRALNMISHGEWVILSSVTGNSGQVKSAVNEIRRRTRKFGFLKIMTDRFLGSAFAITHNLRLFPKIRIYAAAISAMQPLHNLALGEPTNIPLENLIWKFGNTNIQANDLDKSCCGLLYISPVLPTEGNSAFRILKEMKAIAESFNHVLYITLNIESGTSLVAITNLLFDRSSSNETNRAHQCAEALLNFIHKNNLEVYRARIDHMHDIVANDTHYWNTVYSFKQILDPDNIIAPGRYNLIQPNSTARP